MAIIYLEQGSSEWLAWRQSKLTATDISVILESNPFKTKLELWEEKLGFREATKLNSAMQRGQKLEPEARNYACKDFKYDFIPEVHQSDKYSWLAASLDGISSCGNVILEIKCPKESTHLLAIDQIIPPYYLDQMQTQMLVTGAKKCLYMSYRPEYKEQPVVFIEVTPDYEKHTEIIHKGYEFYTQMCTMNPPTEWKFKK